ncbi:MAG: riboflavin synthase [Verrucomicrobiales bacterium]
MFTGLVETTARVVSFEKKGEQARLGFALPFARELAAGDSVAINGCCLTVAEFGDEAVFFDLLSQTLSLTALGDLQVGGLVNAERALAVGDRLGGHFVQGHVDDTGEVRALEKVGQDHRFVVTLPEKVRKFTIPQGSLCVDGISLTIAELGAAEATFWITPHTMSATHLSELAVGARVNLEADLLAKYVKNLLPGDLSS